MTLVASGMLPTWHTGPVTVLAMGAPPPLMDREGRLRPEMPAVPEKVEDAPSTAESEGYQRDRNHSRRRSDKYVDAGTSGAAISDPRCDVGKGELRVLDSATRQLKNCWGTGRRSIGKTKGVVRSGGVACFCENVRPGSDGEDEAVEVRGRIWRGCMHLHRDSPCTTRSVFVV